MGPQLKHAGVLDALGRWPTPQALATAGRRHVRNRIAMHNPRLAAAPADQIVAALEAQTVVVAGTNAAATIVPMLARQLADLHAQRDQVYAQVQALVTDHPLYSLLASMPGTKVRTSAKVLTEAVGKEFPTAGHLASYVGLSPTTMKSGTSIRGEIANRAGNERLKSADVQQRIFIAFTRPITTLLRQETSRTKTHKQAILALARRRLDVLYALLRDGTFYQPQH